jgi:hypothetical protein
MDGSTSEGVAMQGQIRIGLRETIFHFEYP